MEALRVQQFVHMLQRHWAPVTLFVLLALLIESPLIVFPHYAGDSYRDINIAHFGTDTHYYLVRGNEVLQGNNLGNPFLSMNKDMPDPTASYFEQMFDAPLRTLGLAEDIDIVQYYNVLNFLGIIVMLVFMYAFAYELSGSRLLAAAVAIFAVGGYSIIYYKWLFYTNFNIYGRSIFPYASSAPLFAFLLTAYRAIVRKMHYGYVITAGLLFGLLWYDYLYAWSYVLTLLGVLFILYVLRRDWPTTMRIFWISLMGIVLGLPPFISIIRQHVLGDAEQIAYFYFTAYTHAPVMSWVGAVSALLLGIFWYYRRNEQSLLFMLAIIATGWITLNQQVVTGRELDLGHYYWYFVVPLGVILGGVMIWKLLKEQRWVRAELAQMLFGGTLIVLAFVNTVGGQYRSFPTTVEVKLHEQLYAPVLETLDTLPPGVVFADPAGSTYPMLIPIFTAHDLYFARGALVYYTPFSRIKDALLISLFLNTDARRNPRAFLEQELSQNKENAYTQLFGDLEGYDSGLDFRTHTALMKRPDAALLKIRSRVLDEVEHAYKEAFSTGTGVRETLDAGGVKYLVWDTLVYPSWEPTAIPGANLIDDRGAIRLYTLL